MLRASVVTACAIAVGLCAGAAKAQEVSPSSVTGTVLTEGLEAPWDMVWGPNNNIWVTEREGKRVTAVNPANGEKTVLITLDGVHTGPQHEGILGLAVPANLDSGGHVFLGHTYMDGNNEHARIVRLTWDGSKLTEPTPILSGLPAGNDHNGGRLRFSPDGDKLHYTIGEQGHNQGGNMCKPILAQRLPTAEELQNQDYTAYAGKTLRFNLDGSVPSDNPTINGVKSHIFTYGHRNPQGLVWVGDTLFSSEQGPSSDDEINILVGGGNYG